MHTLTLLSGGHESDPFSRSPSFSEVEDRRAYIKRLQQAEMDRVHQSFEPMLQAAGVSYEVTPQSLNGLCPLQAQQSAAGMPCCLL